MIVDDDPRILGSFRGALESVGYEVVIVDSGEKVISIMKREAPDLVLLDIMIPKINGLDVLNAIKSEPKLTETKIIILSALSDKETQSRANKLGAVDYYVKSNVTIEKIIDNINRHLQ